MALWLLEWSPRLGLADRRPFSRRPRPARARALARMRALPGLGGWLADVEGLVIEALEEAGERPAARTAAPQSSVGA